MRRKATPWVHHLCLPFIPPTLNILRGFLCSITSQVDLTSTIEGMRIEVPVAIGGFSKSKNSPWSLNTVLEIAWAIKRAEESRRHLNNLSFHSILPPNHLQGSSWYVMNCGLLQSSTSWMRALSRDHHSLRRTSTNLGRCWMQPIRVRVTRATDMWLNRQSN